MSKGQPEPTLERTRAPFARIIEDHGLRGVEVSVLARPLTPEEAIGQPGRRDFPIIVGKERVLEARVLEARGQAFTDSAREFVGLLDAVLRLDLATNQSRAIYVATLNAVLAQVGIVKATVHCRDDDPEACGLEIASGLRERHGRVHVGLVGFNPAIAESLVTAFGADHVLVSDLYADNVGRSHFGVEIWDGRERTGDLLDAADVVLLTGTTLVNGTFDSIWHGARTRGKRCLVYGMTAAGVSELLGFERICPRSREGKLRRDPA
jgi:uncharacterized protein (DUF4213/DUF364 family)